MPGARVLHSLLSAQDVLDPTSSDDDKIAKLSRPEGVGMCLALFAAAEEEERQKRASGAVSLVGGKEGESQQLPHILHYHASSMTKFAQHEADLDVRGEATVSYNR